MRINVSRVINSPRLKEKFTVWRKAGEWVKGRWEQSETAIEFTGVVIAAEAEDVIQVPEGDRTTEMRVFLSVKPLYVTRDTGTSDEIEWNGIRYRLYQGKNWSNCGYYRVIGVSMEGH